MSQVIVEKDELEQRRGLTRAQEHKIARNGDIAKWQSHGTAGLKPIAKIAGLAFMPVVAFWGLLYAGIAIIITIVSQVFRLLGVLVGRR